MVLLLLLGRRLSWSFRSKCRGRRGLNFVWKWCLAFAEEGRRYVWGLLRIAYVAAACALRLCHHLSLERLFAAVTGRRHEVEVGEACMQRSSSSSHTDSSRCSGHRSKCSSCCCGDVSVVFGVPQAARSPGAAAVPAATLAPTAATAAVRPTGENVALYHSAYGLKLYSA